jgi:hypothetical protein
MKLKQIVWIWPGTSLLALILLIGLCLPTWGAGTCTNFVSDGSFEMEVDPYVPAWRQYSDNFGSPLCNSETCGGSYARPPGAWWAWFGGTGGMADEKAWLEQDITIPADGIIPLEFYLWTQEAGTNPADFLWVMLDGKELFRTTTASSDNLTNYTPVTLNLSGYADGNIHTLRFESILVSATSFFVDDVSRPDKKFVNVSKKINFADDLLQPIIDKTLLAQEIRGQDFDSREDIVVNLDNSAAVLTLKGGFGCDFSEMIPGAKTTIRSLEIRSGKVIAQNLVLKGTL